MPNLYDFLYPAEHKRRYSEKVAVKTTLDPNDFYSIGQKIKKITLFIINITTFYTLILYIKVN